MSALLDSAAASASASDDASPSFSWRERSRSRFGGLLDRLAVRAMSFAFDQTLMPSAGELAAGAQLPSVRGLAAEALVNHNTVARAWRELEHLGVVAGENGRGVFVTPQGPARARELRRAATLAAYERALAEALRSGHDIEELIGRAAALRRHSA